MCPYGGTCANYDEGRRYKRHLFARAHDGSLKGVIRSK